MMPDKVKTPGGTAGNMNSTVNDRNFYYSNRGTDMQSYFGDTRDRGRTTFNYPASAINMIDQKSVQSN